MRGHLGTFGKFLASFVRRLSSRKFLLTVGSSATLLAHHDYLGVIAVVGAYLGANATVAAVSAHGKAKVAAASAVVDRNAEVAKAQIAAAYPASVPKDPGPRATVSDASVGTGMAQPGPTAYR